MINIFTILFRFNYCFTKLDFTLQNPYLIVCLSVHFQDFSLTLSTQTPTHMISMNAHTQPNLIDQPQFHFDPNYLAHNSLQTLHEDTESPLRPGRVPFTLEDLPSVIASIRLGSELSFYYNTALLTLVGLVSLKYWFKRVLNAFHSKNTNLRKPSTALDVASGEDGCNDHHKQSNTVVNEHTPLIDGNKKSSSLPYFGLFKAWVASKYFLISGFLMKQSEIKPVWFFPVTSNGMLVCVVIYYIVNLAYCVYKVPVLKNPLVIGFRLGIISTVNIPLLYVFGVKHSPISFLTGWSYQQLNVLHQHIGNVCCKAVVLHAAMFIWYFRTEYLLTHLWSLGGIVAGSCFTIILISAYPFIKQKCYESFYIIHVLGFVLCLPALWIHHSFTRPYILFAVFSVFYDRAVRFFKAYRLVYGKVVIKPGRTIVIQIPINGSASDDMKENQTEACEHNGSRNDSGIKSHKNLISKLLVVFLPTRHLARWNPGQHSFITVIGCGLFESHPFTIASNYDSTSNFEKLNDQSSTLFQNLDYNDQGKDDHNNYSEGSMNFIIRVQNGFTRRLYDQTKERLDKLETDDQEDWRWIIVHGPYGTPIDRPKFVTTSDEKKVFESRASLAQKSNADELSTSGTSSLSDLTVHSFSPTLSKLSYQPQTSSSTQKSKIVLVAGGAGVAFTYPIYQEYVLEKLRMENSQLKCATNGSDNFFDGKCSEWSNICDVRFFWIIPNRKFLEWLPKSFQDEIEKEEVRVLRGEIHEQERKIRVWVTQERGSRPDIKNEIKAIMTSGRQLEKKDQVFGWAGACGPDGLVRDVCNSIGELRQDGYSQISVYTEVFGW